MDVCNEVDIEQEENKPPVPPPVSAKLHLLSVSETMYSMLGADDGDNTSLTTLYDATENSWLTYHSYDIVDSIQQEPLGAPDDGVYELPAALGGE